MSLIKEFNAIESEMAELQARIQKLKDDPATAVELEFKDKLVALMDEHDKSLRDVIAFLDPGASPRTGSKGRGGARVRRVKRYKNPHTGEIIETKGGNHKGLLAWKEKHGNEEVESWATFV